MRQPPEDVGLIHFTGVGGIGMSGLCEVLNARGYHVQGSDMSDNANVARLRSKGIRVFTDGHMAENVAGVRVLVLSSAIAHDNPELLAARDAGIPIMHRSEMLAELMRLHHSIAVSGSHGKTTTTSLIAHIMDTGGLDPTIVNGGIIKSLGTNARTGTGDWMVAEADESDGSFTKLPATLGIVTNIDREHLEHYGSFDAVIASFQLFVENLPFYGLGVVCWDDPQAQALARRVYKRRILTYGATEGADVQFSAVALAADHSRFEVRFGSRARDLLNLEVSEYSFQLSMVGVHNVANAVAAMIVALHVEVSLETIKTALATFAGVKRRFTRVGVVNGVTFIDDYAHHPAEIEKTLAAARVAATGRVIAIVQPHRYTRLRDLFESFAQSLEAADEVMITPIYAAGEPAIPGVDAQALGAHIQGPRVQLVSSVESVRDILKDALPGDIAVFMGAGSITQWAYETYDALNNVDKN